MAVEITQLFVDGNFVLDLDSFSGLAYIKIETKVNTYEYYSLL